VITTWRLTETGTQLDPALGIAYARLVPWPGQTDEPPFGALACFLEPGQASAPDVHDQDELILLLSGAASVEVDGEAVAAAAGDVVVLDRGRVHVVRNVGDATLSWLSLYWPLHEPPGGPR
jgi:quercetin dioxygenase-like cupin family protein